MTNRITGELPAPTLAQRVASMATGELMVAARGLAVKTDAASGEACTAVLEELGRRSPGAAFDAFVAEIYS